MIKRTLEVLASEHETIEEEVLDLKEKETVNSSRLKYVCEALRDCSIDVQHSFRCFPVAYVQTNYSSQTSMAYDRNEKKDLNNNKSNIKNPFILNKNALKFSSVGSPLGPTLHCIVIPVNQKNKASSLLIDSPLFPSIASKYLHNGLDEVRGTRYV